MTKLTLPVPARCVKGFLAMVPPPPPPLPPLVGGEDNAHSMSADSSPTALAHAVCQVLKAMHCQTGPALPVAWAAKMAKVTAVTTMAMPAAAAKI